MKLKSLAIAVGMTFMAGLTTADAADITLKMGHINQPDSAYGQAAQKFADLVAEKSGGTIELQVFPASQLGPIDALFENLEAGSIDIMVELLEWYGRWDKRYGVFGLPYLFRDRDHVKHFLESDYFRSEMLKTLEDRLDATFFVDEITWDLRLDRTLLCRKPVFTPQDLEGQKLRMFQARIPVLSWETLGANIQIIPWAETYTALATGTVDCITARVEAHDAMRQTEIAKYITITKEFYQFFLPVMSNKSVAKLTPEQLDLIKQAAYEAGEWFADYTGSSQAKYEDLVRDKDGVSIIEPPLAPWRDKISPAYATFEKEGEIPAGMIERVLAVQ